MPFERQQPKIPERIGEIRLEIVDPDGIPGDMKASYFIRIHNQDGSVFREVTGDLLPELTRFHLDRLTQIVMDLRAQAIADMLSPRP